MPHTPEEFAARMLDVRRGYAEADSECRRLRPLSHEPSNHDPGGACSNASRLQGELGDLQEAVSDAIKRLEASQNKLAPECKQGKKESCQQLEKVNDHGLDDTDVMKTLAAYDPSAGINPLGVSQQITNWMVKNCVGGKGNN